VHGEYKIPGGKLVAADLEVPGGQLAQVQISGDFFLEPDDALDRIDAAVTGPPATPDVAAITARVEGALGVPRQRAPSRRRPAPCPGRLDSRAVLYYNFSCF
jgi:hypothetical protein